MLEFSKPILGTGAVSKESGLAKSFFWDLAQVPGQDMAFRKPGGRNLYWYTDRLAKYLDRLQKSEANKRVRKIS